MKNTKENMDSYKVNERAWNAVLAAVETLRQDGQSMASIARLLKVGRATVKRWLDYGASGDKVTFRDMIRYIDRLQIPLEQVFAVPIALPEDLPQPSPTPLDKAIAQALRGVMEVLGKTETTILTHKSTTDIPPEHLRELLAGSRPINVSELQALCTAIGIEATAIMGRGLEIVEEEQEGFDNRRTA